MSSLQTQAAFCMPKFEKGAISLHKLVVTEKPSVAMSIAAALGVKDRKDGYMEGNGWLISWCVGHLAELSDAET